MCSNCHSPRWGRLYLENLDDMMFEMWKIQDRAHLIMDGLAAADAFDALPYQNEILFRWATY
ncbi:hypothetical protein S225a_10440 [Candidatus Brocadiaceae bacterium S225]|nr:hypothetical protein S225a_10440 [Candidatus Brocadiaceae bacterium S225]